MRIHHSRPCLPQQQQLFCFLTVHFALYGAHCFFFDSALFSLTCDNKRKDGRGIRRRQVWVQQHSCWGVLQHIHTLLPPPSIVLFAPSFHLSGTTTYSVAAGGSGGGSGWGRVHTLQPVGVHPRLPGRPLYLKTVLCCCVQPLLSSLQKCRTYGLLCCYRYDPIRQSHTLLSFLVHLSHTILPLCTQPARCGSGFALQASRKVPEACLCVQQELKVGSGAAQARNSVHGGHCHITPRWRRAAVYSSRLGCWRKSST